MTALKRVLVAIAILVLIAALGGGVWAMTREDGHEMAGMGGGQSAAADGDHDMASMGGASNGEPFDQAFIDNMVPHHQAAVEMAELELDNGQRAELKQMAKEIVDAQDAEIDQMRAWREAWYGSDETPAEMSMEMPGMDVESLEGADDPDAAFIDAMIPHHESAIRMAEEARTRAEHPEIRSLANAIIAAQRAEIDQLRQWRSEWYGR